MTPVESRTHLISMSGWSSLKRAAYFCGGEADRRHDDRDAHENGAEPDECPVTHEALPMYARLGRRDPSPATTCGAPDHREVDVILAQTPALCQGRRRTVTPGDPAVAS